MATNYFFFFLVGKLQTHRVGFEPMTLASILLLWKEELLFELRAHWQIKI